MGVGVRAISVEHIYLRLFCLSLAIYFVMVGRKLRWCESAVLHCGNKNIEKHVVMWQRQLSDAYTKSLWVKSIQQI